MDKANMDQLDARKLKGGFELREFQELSAADFPGVNTRTFEEFKKARMLSDLVKSIMTVVVIVAWLSWFLSQNEALIPFVIPIMILYVILPSYFGKKSKDLEKEMGITEDLITKALKGEKPAA